MILLEVQLLPDFSQAERYRNSIVRNKTNPIADNIDRGEFELISKSKQHTIYLEQHARKNWKHNARFYAVNNQTGLVDMTVDGDIKRTGTVRTFTVSTLDGRRNSGMRAYEFYRAMMLGTPLILVTDAQSYGGLRTWQELAKYRDIEVFGWLDGHPVNVDPSDPEDTHATEREANNSRVDSSDAASIIRMKLVAHRKMGRGR